MFRFRITEETVHAMAFGVAEMIEGVRQGRKNFLNHIDGVTPEQATWKPYPQCKSIAETLDHLLWSDRATVQLLESGQDPDYTTAPDGPPAESFDTLKAQLAESHDALIAYLEQKYAGSTPDETVKFYGHPMPLYLMLTMMPQEESYHAGQIAYIRMASDPSWDYYAALYPNEG